MSLIKIALGCGAAVALLVTTACGGEPAGPVAQITALTPCSANAIGEPAPFEWTYHPVSADNPKPYYSGTMEVGEADFVIGGETLTTRAYRQAGGSYSIPGPTITMVPGNKYVLRFHNTLPYETASGRMNELKDPNIANLHTHGLHISGESPGDDVTRSFPGGYGGDFVYDIPADHMGGTYWYHAHHHGSTYLQVAGGAFGLLLIDDSRDGIPAPVAAMKERQLLIAYLDTSAAGAGGDTLMSGTLRPSWTVNGTIQGDLCAPVGEWQHWRVLLADPDAREKTLAVGSSCELALLARDGVWRSTAPKSLAGNAISLTGASRADLAVRCSGDAQITVDGNPVANIHATGTGDTTVHPYAEDGVSTWSAIRPAYLRDLRGETDVHRETISMGARTINGSKFSLSTPLLSLPATSVQDWTLKGARNHPFHLHVYHMQTAGCGGDYEDGEYYDTVASNCRLRFDLTAATSSPYRGRTIMHCHILQHEDQGAMTWLDVAGGQGPPTLPADSAADPPYAAYYALDAGPAPQPTAVQVGSITVTTISAGKGQKQGRATVVVKDDLGDPVQGAAVSGAFGGGFDEVIAASDPTNANGTTTIDSTASAKGSFSLSFCVTAISHPALQDFSGQVCGSL